MKGISPKCGILRRYGVRMLGSALNNNTILLASMLQWPILCTPNLIYHTGRTIHYDIKPEEQKEGLELLDAVLQRVSKPSSSGGIITTTSYGLLIITCSGKPPLSWKNLAEVGTYHTLLTFQFVTMQAYLHHLSTHLHLSISARCALQSALVNFTHKYTTRWASCTEKFTCSTCF